MPAEGGSSFSNVVSLWVVRDEVSFDFLKRAASFQCRFQVGSSFLIAIRIFRKTMRCLFLLLTYIVSIAAMQSTTRSLRKHLLSGGRSYGPMLLSDSPIVAELLATIGYTHMIVDHEHCPTDIRSGSELLRAIQAVRHYHRCEAIVRVPSPKDPVYMKKVLDSMTLPGGVLVPMVDDATTAMQVVESSRYPVDGGIRGCAAPFVRASSFGSDAEYLTKCREDLLVMVQVETAKGVDAIPEIASVDGVDAIFIGPLDLSASIGKMGMFEDEEVRQLLLGAEEAVRQSGCLLAGFRHPGRNVGEMFQGGYSLVCGSLDVGMLKAAALSDLESAKEFL